MFGMILTVYKYFVRPQHQGRSARELCHTAHVQSGVNPQQTIPNKETTKPHHAGAAEVEVRSQYMSHMHFVQPGLTAPKTIIKECITVEY